MKDDTHDMRITVRRVIIDCQSEDNPPPKKIIKM